MVSCLPIFPPFLSSPLCPSPSPLTSSWVIVIVRVGVGTIFVRLTVYARSAVFASACSAHTVASVKTGRGACYLSATLARTCIYITALDSHSATDVAPVTRVRALGQDFQRRKLGRPYPRTHPERSSHERACPTLPSARTIALRGTIKIISLAQIPATPR